MLLRESSGDAQFALDIGPDQLGGIESGSSAPLRRPVQNMQHQSLIHNAQPHELLPMDEVIVQSQVEFNYPEDETAAVADDIDEFD